MNGKQVRWGVMSTANIAAGNFLPSLRASGNGMAAAVASRSLEAAQDFARRQDIPQAVEGYGALLQDDSLDAIYIPLPNNLHAEWTIASLRAGKAVLCEKPLCLTVEETERVLAVARETGRLLWEAFVFPFNRQSARLREILDSGAIGEPAEVMSTFHFRLTRTTDIRLNPETGGGALYDVGCYSIRLADLVFGVTPDRAAGMMTRTDSGVDATTEAVLNYPDRGRLVLSCSIALSYDTQSAVAGTEGEIRLSQPFHPLPDATLRLTTRGETHIERLGTEEPTFTEAVRAMNAAILGQSAPEHLAINEALPVAVGMQLIREATA
ncbi:MAG TPA: Gfo/Idh/MocA family oxidoreductase [Chloroflexota bacterium]|nr:Gfo/Idh/MocA family oxidoreductase [Chloroflexota bacterium]